MYLLAENEQIVRRGHGGHVTWHADASSGHRCNFHHPEVPQHPQGGGPQCTNYKIALEGYGCANAETGP